MIKIFTISTLLALGFSQDKWELKFGNYYYSPIDSTKPVHLTQASIYIDSNQNKDFTFNRIDKSKVDDYLISLKSNQLYVETIENIIRKQEPIPSIVLNVLSDDEKVELSNSFHISEDIMYKLSNQLQNLITIDNTNGTSFYTIHTRSSYPSQAAFLINTLIDTFVKMDTNLKVKEGRIIEEFLLKQLDQESENLSYIELKLKSFQEKEKIYQLDSTADFFVNQLLVIASSHHEIENECLILKERKKYLLEQLSAKEIELSSESYSRLDNRFYSLKEKIASLESEYLESKAVSGEEQSETKDINREIKIARKTLEGIINRHVIQRDMVTDGVEYRKSLIDNLIRIDLELDINKIRLKKSEDLMNNFEQNLNLMPSKLIEFANLQIDYSVSYSAYAQLRQKIEEEKIKQASQTSAIRIIDYAVSPTAE